MSGPDKRRDERVPASGIAIRVRFADVSDLEQYFVRDISRGGIFLRAKNLKPLHSQLYVVLTLPDGTEIKLKGEVVHVVTPEEATAQRPAGMGVQFLDLTPDIKQQIADYVERLKGRGTSQLIHPDVIPSAPAQRAASPTPSRGVPAARSASPTPSQGVARVVSPTPSRGVPAVRAPVPTPSQPVPAARARVPTPNQPIPQVSPPAEAGPEFKDETSQASGQTFEDENDQALLRRLCWLLAEGGIMGRPIREVFGLPSSAPAILRREVFERLHKALAPEKPPRHLGSEEARAVTRLLALLEQLTRED